MSETTNIEWATSTGNPWIGCTKISPGCKNCYAAVMDARKFSKTMGGGTSAKPESHWGPGAPRVRTKRFWKDALVWNRTSPLKCPKCSRVLIKPLGGDGTCGTSIAFDHHSKEHTFCDGIPYRARIFPSLCDWLDDEVPIEWLADFLKLIHDTPNLDWLLLTKRPENFSRRLLDSILKLPGVQYQNWAASWQAGATVPDNVWLGVSVEDQARADERIPLLLRIPAKVRFLSVEPLLEKVLIYGTEKIDDAYGYRASGMAWSERNVQYKRLGKPGIDWVIVGGESGSNRRDPGVEPLCDVARQCVAAGVPCFVKQDCAFKPGQKGRIPDEVWGLKEFPKGKN